MESVEGRNTHVVWKFNLMELVATGVMEVPWRKGSKILHIGKQGSAGNFPINFYAWVEVPLEAELETRRFMMVGTGHEFEKESSDSMIKMEYVATIFSDEEGTYVFHIYELLVR